MLYNLESIIEFIGFLANYHSVRIRRCCNTHLFFRLRLISFSLNTHLIPPCFLSLHIYLFTILFVKDPYKRVWMSKKIEIFVDLTRAGHDKSVKKIAF